MPLCALLDLLLFCAIASPLRIDTHFSSVCNVNFGIRRAFQATQEIAERRFRKGLGPL